MASKLITPHKVLVTGSMGSGKSTLARVLRKAHKKAYDSDLIGEIGAWQNNNGEVVVQLIDMDWVSFLNENKFTWNSDTVKELLSKGSEVYLLGFAHNAYDLRELFTDAFYLQAKKDILLNRLKSRDVADGIDVKKLEKILDVVVSWTDFFDKRAKDSGFTFLDATLSPQELLKSVVRN